jgi:hypothetical protein
METLIYSKKVYISGILRMLYKEEVTRVNGRNYRKNTIKLYLLVLFVAFSLPFLLHSVEAATLQTPSEIYGIMGDGSTTTNYLNLTFQFRACSTSDCSNSNWTTYGNSTLTLLSSLDNSSYFQYRAIFYTENQNYSPYLFNVSVDYTYLDTITPLVSFIDPTPLNNSGASGSFIVNVSVVDEALSSVVYNWNGTISTYSSSSPEVTYLGNDLWAFTYTQTGLEVGRTYVYNVTVIDYAGNSNHTETRTIKGNTVPSVISISYTPTTLDDLDPGVPVLVSINVRDLDNNFDSAVLQWKNTTEEWGVNNVTMENTTLKDITTNLSGSFTPLSESNYSFRILLNDSTGDYSISNVTNISVFWDCTWTATSDLGASAGWDQNKWIGNISINNTGDIEYANNNCSLDFRLGYNLPEGRIYYDGEYLKNFKSYTITAKDNQTISINASFLSEVNQENVLITLEEVRQRSNNRYANTTSILVSNKEGPYLYNKITKQPSIVYLTSSEISIQGYLRNLMGSSIINENNTAYNVNFYWSLPSGIVNSSGATNQTYENITSNDLNYINTNITFSNLASFSPGIGSIKLYALGYNLSGNLISDSSGSTLTVSEANVTFSCYDVKDNVCVSACGYLLDPDCSQPSTPSSNGGSSGGSGGGAGTVKTEQSRADYQFVRGKQNEIIVQFTNKDINKTMKNILFNVGGGISKYIEVLPSKIEYLGPRQSVNITLKITSPGYLKIGQEKITLDINGNIDNQYYSERREIILQINDLSKDEAEELLNKSLILIKELNEDNLTSDVLNNLILESNKAFEDLDYSKVKSNYEVISDQVTKALNAKKTIIDLEALVAGAKERGISVTNTERMLRLIELSIERGEFDQAYERSKEALSTYALETKGEFSSLSYYLRTNSKEVSLAAAFLILTSFVTYKVTRLSAIKRKIKKLKEEEFTLTELIKVIQRHTFKDKKMSMEEYQEAMLQYSKKLSNVIEQLISTENERVHALKFTSEDKKLKVEREKLILLIKELQTDYLKKGKVETRVYELKLKSYNRRIGEIDQRLATLEAQREIGRRFPRLPFIKK